MLKMRTKRVLAALANPRARREPAGEHVRNAITRTARTCARQSGAYGARSVSCSVETSSRDRGMADSCPQVVLSVSCGGHWIGIEEAR